MFISFEGIDGCGKGTQIELLKKYFANNNIKSIFVNDPGTTVAGSKLREILLDKTIQLDPEVELILYNACRIQLEREVIIPALDEGLVVVSDRYSDSTYAYQHGGRCISMELLECKSDLEPQITFFLDIDVETSERRRNERNTGDNDRFETLDKDFYSRVRSAYQTLARRHPERIITIDGTKSIDEIHDIIVKTLKERFAI